MISKTAGIYMFTNNITGEHYIGQSNDIYRRKKDHLQYTKQDKCSAFQRSLQKHGEDVFKFEILEILDNYDRKVLNEREHYWIDFYGSFREGLNLTSGGGACDASPETIQKLSESKMGCKNPNYGCIGMFNSFFGQHHDKDIIEFIRQVNTGRVATEKERKKQSDAQIGKRWYNNGIKQIFCYPKNKPKGFKKGQLLVSIEKNRQSHLGLRCYTNGIKFTYAKECPEGYWPGGGRRLTFEQTSRAMKGKHWYNNGVKNCCAYECPEGFVQGKLKK
jgi:group I intron endonuclease